MNKVQVIKDSSFAGVKNSFEIMATRGGERLERQGNFLIKSNAMLFRARVIY